MKCPWDKQSLRPNAKGQIAPLPNYQLQEILEVNKDYDVCPDHPNEFQRLFCKTDKVKICPSCHLSAGEKSHKNHDVDMIENLKPAIEERRRLYDEGLKKSKIFDEKIQGALNAKKKILEDEIEAHTKIHALVRFKVHMMIRDYLDSQKKNVQKKVEENFESRKQTEEMVASDKEFKKLNLGNILSKSPEDIRAQYDEGKFDHVFVESENDMKQQASNLYEKFRHIYDQQEINTAFEFQSYLSIHLDGQNLKLFADNIMKTIVIDLDQLKEVKAMTIVFDTFGFNQEDIKVIQYVFSSLQAQLDSIELHYKNIRDIMTRTKFETHLVLFSLMIFENPKNYKSIALIFENSDGSERYLRFLGEALSPEKEEKAGRDCLESLTLTFKNANLDEEILANFFHQTRRNLKELKSFSLNIEGSFISSQTLDQEVLLELPNLERLNLTFNVKVLFERSIGTVIGDLLTSTKNLKECRIYLENAPKVGLSFIKPVLSFVEMETLVIQMPHSLFPEKDIEHLTNKLANRLKKLKNLEIIANTINDQTYLPRFSLNNISRSQLLPGNFFSQNSNRSHSPRFYNE